MSWDLLDQFLVCHGCGRQPLRPEDGGLCALCDHGQRWSGGAKTTQAERDQMAAHDRKVLAKQRRKR